VLTVHRTLLNRFLFLHSLGLPSLLRCFVRQQTSTPLLCCLKPLPCLLLLPLQFLHVFPPLLLLQLFLHPVDPIVIAGAMVGHGNGYELEGIDKA
jgi:hypothetical protein